MEKIAIKQGVMSILLLFCLINIFAQQDNFKYYKYSYVMVPKADNLYDAGEYRKSIEYNLTKVDSIGDIINVHNYILAQNYALLGIEDSAFYFLNQYVDGIPRDYRSVYVDQDFELLKNNKKEWSKLIAKIEDVYIQELDSTMNEELALQLFRMDTEIIKYTTLSTVSYRRKEYPSKREVAEFGIKCKKELKKNIRKYGFPTPSKVGYTASDVAFYILQHSKIEDKYYYMAKKAYEEGDCYPENYALLTDRWLVQNNKSQIYGTQLIAKRENDGKMGKYILQPVEDFKNINQRRSELGLPPIEEYVEKMKGIIPEEYYNE